MLVEVKQFCQADGTELVHLKLEVIVGICHQSQPDLYVKIKLYQHAAGSEYICLNALQKKPYR